MYWQTRLSFKVRASGIGSLGRDPNPSIALLTPMARLLLPVRYGRLFDPFRACRRSFKASTLELEVWPIAPLGSFCGTA